jgi:hypothetical protein
MQVVPKKLATLHDSYKLDDWLYIEQICTRRISVQLFHHDWKIIQLVLTCQLCFIRLFLASITTLLRYQQPISSSKQAFAPLYYQQPISPFRFSLFTCLDSCWVIPCSSLPVLWRPCRLKWEGEVSYVENAVMPKGSCHWSSWAIYGGCRAVLFLSMVLQRPEPKVVVKSLQPTL